MIISVGSWPREASAVVQLQVVVWQAGLDGGGMVMAGVGCFQSEYTPSFNATAISDTSKDSQDATSMEGFPAQFLTDAVVRPLC